MLKSLVKSKIAVFSTVLALILTAISASSVFAASATAPNSANRSLATIWGNQFREVQADRVFYNNIKSHAAEIRNASKPSEVQQYLARYAFALTQSETIILHDSPTANINLKASTKFERSLTAQQQLAMYLHMMSGLRDKLGFAR